MHAPGHLRYAFSDWVEIGMPVEIAAEGPTYDFYDGKPRMATWLLGQLWRCSDIMPGTLCDELDMPAGSTYARAAQQLAAERSLELA